MTDYQTLHDTASAGVARLRVVGVGGAGGNAVRSMLRAQLRGVDLLAINTDAQALAQTGAPVCLRIGEQLTRGLGAGGNPETGLRAAEESRDAIRAALAGSDMVFVTAGMGGGTGTGAGPAVALIARELGALVVGIVSTPFAFEGAPRRKTAERGLVALREQVDTLIVVPNERLLRLAGRAMRMSEAYALADDVLRGGVQAISDLIAVPGHINLDFADVRAVMADAGSALMATGQASGEGRAREAPRAALGHPLVDLEIAGARALLVNITGGPDLMIHEVSEVVETLREQAHPEANVLFGTVEDEAFAGQLKVTLVAAGFEPRVAATPSPSRSDLTPHPSPARAGERRDLSPNPSPTWGGEPEAARSLRRQPETAWVAGPHAGRDDEPRGDEPRVAADVRSLRLAPGARHDASAAREADETDELAELDEPRAGPAEMAPASALRGRAAPSRGLDAPGFWRRRG
jgi:cell division protein FtsZ